MIARNKQAITLDLRQAEGQQLLLELAAKSDILIENFRPGTLEKWNLGYPQLSAANPRLIMVRVSGYGQTGPYAGRAGFGAIGEAMGGLRYVVGDPAAPPSRVGISIGDALAATFACVGALSALHYREKTGRGQVVDSAIYEAVLGMMESLVTEYDQTGYIRERTGPILPNVAPSNVYPARDGLVLIAANQDTVFRRLCEAMDQPGLAEDARYVNHQSRGANQLVLDEHIAAWTAGLATREVLALMERHGVPAGRSTARRRCSRTRTSRRARRSSRCRTRSSGRCAAERGAEALCDAGPHPPALAGLGEHNEAVYRELLGLTPERYVALKADRVI